MAFNNFSSGYSRDTRPVMPAAVRVTITGTIPADLFSDQALSAARSCNDPKKNASTQLRRFYDELVMWHDKVFADASPEKRKARFDAAIPYIQMLRAKAAYAKGRDLVNENFQELFDSLIRQIHSPEDLHTARLFMEAFMGFKKYLEKSKNN